MLDLTSVHSDPLAVASMVDHILLSSRWLVIPHEGKVTSGDAQVIAV